MLKKRVYWIVALLALLALSGAAISLTSRITSADNPTPTAAVANSDQQGEVDDAAEAPGSPDTDAVEEQSGAQDEGEAVGAQAADEANQADEQQASVGKIDDGADLLPQASITLDQAIAAAQGVATGTIGEIDLEKSHGKLVFNVDVGDKDVKVDAADGSIVSADSDD